eukprot:m.165619 g.165619  ORF g.165619 m.165619 type:complete len:65 (-) comp10328_c0_seq11:518-712(-)
MTPLDFAARSQSCDTIFALLMRGAEKGIISAKRCLRKPSAARSFQSGLMMRSVCYPEAYCQAVP